MYRLNYAKNRPSIASLSSNDGRKIANVYKDQRDRVYSEKKIDATKHILFKPHSLAYDQTALDLAVKLRVDYHRVIDQSTGFVWCAEHWKFAKFGILINRGHGLQLALEMKHWHESPEPPEPAQDCSLRLENGGASLPQSTTQCSLFEQEEAA